MPVTNPYVSYIRFALKCGVAAWVTLNIATAAVSALAHAAAARIVTDPTAPDRYHTEWLGHHHRRPTRAGMPDPAVIDRLLEHHTHRVNIHTARDN
jgi:hypothetical protein